MFLSFQISLELICSFIKQAYVLQFERGESWVKMGINIILSHPVSTIKAFIRGVLGTLLVPGGAYHLVAFKLYKPGSGILNRLYELGFVRFLTLLWREYRYLFLMEVAFGLYFLFLYVVSFLGFWRNLFRREVWLLTLTIAYFLFISAGPKAY